MKKRNPFHKRLLSTAECTRHYRRCLFSTLVFGVFLSSCSGRSNEVIAPTMMPASTEFTFEQYEVKTGIAKHQTVLTGFLLGGDLAELAVVNIGENGNRHLHIYTFSEGAWVSELDVTLHPEVLFVDVANIGGRDRSNHVRAWSPELV